MTNKNYSTILFKHLKFDNNQALQNCTIMKTTKIKIFCFFISALLSMNAYSQLIIESSSGGIIGKCFEVEGGNYNYCANFILPFENLTYDYLNPITNKDEVCYPVNNFGCDLHIGLTYEGNNSTAYSPITSCTIAEIIAAMNADPDDAVAVAQNPYPNICIEIPILDKFDNCIEGLFEFSIDLYCKDLNGDFTPMSEIANADVFNNWASVFPGGRDGKSVMNSETWSTDICCDDTGISPVNPDIEGVSPLIGQNDDGSKAFIRNFQDISRVSISVFDANNQAVVLSNRVNLISNNDCSIDLTYLNSGIYFIRVIDNNIVYSKTIIKM